MNECFCIRFAVAVSRYFSPQVRGETVNGHDNDFARSRGGGGFALRALRCDRGNEYPVDEFEIMICQRCGGKVFNLFSDDDESGALRQCVQCSEKQYIGDSQEYMNQDDVENHECMCGNKNFQITVGRSFYEDSKDARWVYVGGYCSGCGMVGNYVDWNER